MFPLSLSLEHPIFSPGLSTQIAQELRHRLSQPGGLQLLMASSHLQERGGTPARTWARVVSPGMAEHDRRDGRKMGKMQESQRFRTEIRDRGSLTRTKRANTPRASPGASL